MYQERLDLSDLQEAGQLTDLQAGVMSIEAEGPGEERVLSNGRWLRKSKLLHSTVEPAPPSRQLRAPPRHYLSGPSNLAWNANCVGPNADVKAEHKIPSAYDLGFH